MPNSDGIFWRIGEGEGKTTSEGDLLFVSTAAGLNLEDFTKFSEFTDLDVL